MLNFIRRYIQIISVYIQIYFVFIGNEDGVFRVVKETGEIRLVKLLDYEYTQLFTLTIRASNRPPYLLYAQTRVSINVLDVNDNRPQFADDIVSRFLSENSSISTPVSLAFYVFNTFVGERESYTSSVYLHPEPCMMFAFLRV